MTDESFDVSKTTAPKSDQLNADDLMYAPRDFTIVAVRPGDREQPVWVYLDGLDRPWKPSLSMRRLMCALFGVESSGWIGQTVRLYRDPEVTYGGVKMGGIKVSHATIPERTAVMLTTRKNGRATHTVDVLDAPAPRAPEQPAEAQGGLDDGLITKQQSALLFANLKALGLDTPAAGLAYINDALERNSSEPTEPISTTKQLTRRQAGLVIDTSRADIETFKKAPADS